MQIYTINNLHFMEAKHLKSSNNKTTMVVSNNTVNDNSNLSQIRKAQVQNSTSFGERTMNPGLEFYCNIRNYMYYDNNNPFYQDENNLVQYFYDNLSEIKPYINTTSPRTGNTVLHVAAMYHLHELLDAILKNCDVDLSVANKEGKSVEDILKRYAPVALDIYRLRKDDTVSPKVKEKLNKDNVDIVKKLLEDETPEEEILKELEKIKISKNDKQSGDEEYSPASALSHSTRRHSLLSFFAPWG